MSTGNISADVYVILIFVVAVFGCLGGSFALVEPIYKLYKNFERRDVMNDVCKICKRHCSWMIALCSRCVSILNKSPISQKLKSSDKATTKSELKGGYAKHSVTRN